MALFQCSLFSTSLCFGTSFHVIIPSPDSDELMNKKDSSYFKKGVEFPVLYLLHGAYGDYTDWQRQTGIERYAQKHKIAVVMPSASNSFYQDMYRGSAYYTYLTEELPSFIERTFPVSTRREDTFVAGLSMGGYGALRLTLMCPEKYQACISLSGAVDLEQLMGAVNSGNVTGPFQWHNIFEHPEGIRNTEADLFYLMERNQKQNRPIPDIFQSCGTEDFLYSINVAADKKMTDMGIRHTFETHPGVHDWDYWDLHIQRALDWLSLNNHKLED
jgi:S-formylglutathione hydrolase FrmB